MIKPKKLKEGDKVATVSLSSGGAGDKKFRHRYELGKKRLEEVFKLKEIEMENSLKGSEYLAKHPEARAKDFMDAFKDEEIKAIFTNIGGNDSIRLLPYIDFDVIKNNPKILVGYSDSTTNHLMCYKAGLISFYGPCVIEGFAENFEMHDYTLKWVEKTLFSSEEIGVVEASNYWTSEFLDWKIPENNRIKRKLSKNIGYELLQGTGIVEGNLIGGCVETLERLKDTELWIETENWKDKILFLETSEMKMSPEKLKDILVDYKERGIFNNINGLIIGKPKDEAYYKEYKEIYLSVIKDQLKRENLPIIYNMNFGHTAPQCILPYGVRAQINCDKLKFTILESGVCD